MSQLPGFGDNVRVLATPLTIERGLAGETGQVYGFTTPSYTGVGVIGVCQYDYALNVYFEERHEAFWFAPDLLEFLDYGVRNVIGVAGRKMVRASDGSWQELDESDFPKRPL